MALQEGKYREIVNKYILGCVLGICSYQEEFLSTLQSAGELEFAAFTVSDKLYSKRDQVSSSSGY